MEVPVGVDVGVELPVEVFVPVPVGVREELGVPVFDEVPVCVLVLFFSSKFPR